METKLLSIKKLLFKFLKKNGCFEEFMFQYNRQELVRPFDKFFKLRVKKHEEDRLISLAFPWDATSHGFGYWYGISYKWQFELHHTRYIK